jgi:uncharacterized protein (DUF433 family)
MKFDPRDQPAYTFSEAARYLRLPVATLRTWFLGYKSIGPNGAPKHAPGLIAPCSKSHLSFFNLVEAHVLAAIRRQHQVSPPKVRNALSYTRKQLGAPRPLLRENFETDGVDLFVRRLGELIQVSANGQSAMREVFEAHLLRIDRDAKGVPIKLYPFSSGNETSGDKSVVINPTISFGRPIVAGTNVAIEVIANRYAAGDSIDELAADFRLSRSVVETAVRVELLARQAA